MKSAKIRLKLNYNQIVILETMSNEHRLLYNFLLNKVKESKESNFKDISELSKNYRNNNKLTINAKSAQNTSRQLIQSILGFYSLHKKDKTAKFPYKFRSYKYFNTFMYDWNKGNGGFKFYDDGLEVSLISKQHKLKIDFNKGLLKKFNISNSNIKTITFKREEDQYYLICVYSEKNNNLDESNKVEYNYFNNIENKNNFISLDLGVTDIYTSFSNTIRNESVSNCRFTKLKKQSNKIQSISDNKKRGSKKWKKIRKKFKKINKKIINKHKDFQHKLSSSLINICVENNIGSLFVGDIQVKKIINKDNKKIKSTSKSFGLSRFKTFLEYKAKNANIDFYLVNESFTSQDNCLTGEREFSSALCNRSVKLNGEIEIDRDLNSAINIAKKIKGKWLTQFVIQTNKFELDKMYMDCHSKKIECLYMNISK